MPAIPPPISSASQRVRATDTAEASAAIGLSPTARTFNPKRVPVSSSATAMTRANEI